MAADKKTTAKVEAPKAVAAKKAVADTKTAAPVQAETEKKETVKSEAAAVKKTAEGKKTEEKKAAEAKKATTAKKTTGRGRKATTVTTAKKAELKSELHLQFGGNSYTQDELVKIAKDVWKYDLKKKVGDFKSVELYVKPEESIVYYVINGEERGHFSI